MKAFILSLVLLSSHAFAAPVDSRVCTAGSKTHNFRLQEVTDGVQASFENSSLKDLGKIGNSPSFKISGKQQNTIVIKAITLAEALKNTPLLKESLVSILMARSEFQGEEDMFYAYANDYVSTLVCK